MPVNFKDALLAFAPGIKDERRKEWDDLVQKNPDLARDAEEYNRGLQEYTRTRRAPTQRPTGGEVRFQSGAKTEEELPGGGVGVTFPTTEVKPEMRPLRIGKDIEEPVYDDGQGGLARFKTDPAIKGLPYKVIGGNRLNVPDITPEQAEAIMKASPEEIAAAFPNGVPHKIFQMILQRKKQMEGGGGRGGKSPQQITDEITIRGYEAMKRQHDFLGEPLPIPEDYTAEYLAARGRLGMPPPARAEQAPPSADQPPAAALEQIKSRGRVKFGNGQVWEWKDGKAVRAN